MAEKRARTPKKLKTRTVLKPLVVDLVQEVEEKPRQFNDAEIEFIKNNYGKIPIKNIAKSLNCDEAMLDKFIEHLYKPNPQRTEAVKGSFARRGGATVATQASSTMGDESRKLALRKNPDFIHQIEKNA